jgi:cystathionine beta-lyase
MSSDKNASDKIDTILTVAGRDPAGNYGVVNPPVYHASTIIFPSLAAQEKASGDPFNHMTYGRAGTPTQHALEETMSLLEGAYRTVAVPSGLAAITGAILGFVSAGDHMLVSDSAYGPTRRFAVNFLKRFGVETTFFDPTMGAEVERLVQPNTKLFYVEAPGSLTFEMQDIPAIAKVAHAHGAIVVADNTWATPVYCQPIKLGADIVVHAGTKYVVGHSDAMMGLICCSQATYNTVKTMAGTLGFHAAPDDSYLALRGLRTLAVRLRRHEQSALEIARWLQTRPEVEQVLHPALPDCPGHDIWKRDFTGSSGLFAFTLKGKHAKPAIAAMVDHMKLFGIGFSWGGYESLMIHAHPETYRTAVPWPADRTLIRVHIGLDDVEDIKADLAAGFERMKQAARTAAE